GRLAQVAEAKNGATQSSAYSSYRLSEVQEPHPQPPPRKRGGGYDVPSMINKRYISCPLDYLLNPKNPTPPKLGVGG
ncbi:MAG: hypothetical protein ACYT04_56765, partial [Nostoc sp.]